MSSRWKLDPSYTAEQAAATGSSPLRARPVQTSAAAVDGAAASLRCEVPGLAGNRHNIYSLQKQAASPQWGPSNSSKPSYGDGLSPNPPRVNVGAPPNTLPTGRGGASVLPAQKQHITAPNALSLHAVGRYGLLNPGPLAENTRYPGSDISPASLSPSTYSNRLHAKLSSQRGPPSSKNGMHGTPVRQSHPQAASAASGMGGGADGVNGGARAPGAAMVLGQAHLDLNVPVMPRGLATSVNPAPSYNPLLPQPWNSTTVRYRPPEMPQPPSPKHRAPGSAAEGPCEDAGCHVAAHGSSCPSSPCITSSGFHAPHPLQPTALHVDCIRRMAAASHVEGGGILSQPPSPPLGSLALERPPSRSARGDAPPRPSSASYRHAGDPQEPRNGASNSGGGSTMPTAAARAAVLEALAATQAAAPSGSAGEGGLGRVSCGGGVGSTATQARLTFGGCFPCGSGAKAAGVSPGRSGAPCMASPLDRREDHAFDYIGGYEVEEEVVSDVDEEEEEGEEVGEDDSDGEGYATSRSAAAGVAGGWDARPWQGQARGSATGEAAAGFRPVPGIGLRRDSAGQQVLLVRGTTAGMAQPGQAQPQRPPASRPPPVPQSRHSGQPLAPAQPARGSRRSSQCSGGGGSTAGSEGTCMRPPTGDAGASGRGGSAGSVSRGSGGSRDGSLSASRPATASSAWSAYDALLPADTDPLGPGPSTAPSRTSFGCTPPVLSSVRGAGAGRVASATSRGSAGSANASVQRRAASNPRDARLLVARGTAAGGGGGAQPPISRCSSATSRGSGGLGGGGARGALQSQALLASLGLASPTTPSTPGSCSGAASPLASTARRRSPPRQVGKGGGGGTPHGGGFRSLHPAVLAVVTPVMLGVQNGQSDGRSSNSGASRPVDEVPTDAKGRAYPYLQPPAHPGTHPSIACVGSAAAKQAAGLQPLLEPTLYVKYGGVANTPVKHAFREAGFRTTKKGKRWLVQWGGILDAAALGRMHAFQRVNHFPGTWELGHKGHLYRNVAAARRRARGAAADAFDVVPRFYLLPRDYDEWRTDCERFPDRLYIQKPTNSSRGRGIRMVSRPETVSRDAHDTLLQHYVSNPLLLNGHKFDLRVYAAATCLDPLRLYVFPDGLARLASEPYSSDRADLSKRCVHLTNYSVNKKSTKFVKAGEAPAPAASQSAGTAGTTAGALGGGSRKRLGAGGAPTAAQQLAAAAAASDPASECVGGKWSLAGLRAYLEARGQLPPGGWAAVWRQVQDIVAAAVIAAEPRMNTESKMKVPHRNNCFEVWGFDIMLTDTFRAWLIEANTCPSLAADSALDMRVKAGMVAQLLHLTGPVPYDTEVYERAVDARRQARLTGLAAPRPAAAGAGEEGGAAAQLQAQHSFGSGTGGGGGAVVARTLQELEGVDFAALGPHELPDVVLEAEAEMARRGSWQRVFPSEEDPARYLDLFETPRLNNLLLAKYYTAQQRATGGSRGGAAAAARRPGSVGRGGRPASRDTARRQG